MSTHLHGAPPERIFRTRRPLESTNEYALTYRLENFQPITKQSFNQAVSAIVETVNHIYVQFDGVDDTTASFVDDYAIKAMGRTYSFDQYMKHYVPLVAESDPNAVIVVMPMHPTQELIPDFREELPDFNAITNEFVDIEVKVIPSDMVHYVDDMELWYKAGEWVYDVERNEEKSKPYYFVVDAEYTRLAIPVKSAKDGYDYMMVDYYFNDLENAPFEILGHNSVMERIDKEYVEYKESTYAGAVAIANEVLAVKSDEQICTTRFTYPEKYLHMERCSYPGCVECKDPGSKYAGLYVNYADDGSCSTCSNCNGTGQVAPDTSPLGTHFVAKSDVWDEHGRFTPLIGFVTPPLESPKYLDDKWRKDFDQMEKALFVVSQNMTNQSGESKSYDWRMKVTTLTKAATNIYHIYESVLNSIQGFFRGEEVIEVLLPPDFNIRSTMDITEELGEAQNTSSLYTSELTRELMLKKFGSTEKNRKIIDFLELNDKLFGMTVEEILKLKAIYGNALTPRDQIAHDKGFAVLKKIAEREDFERLSDEALLQLFNEAIDRIAPVVTPTSPIA